MLLFGTKLQAIKSSEQIILSDNTIPTLIIPLCLYEKHRPSGKNNNMKIEIWTKTVTWFFTAFNESISSFNSRISFTFWSYDEKLKH